MQRPLSTITLALLIATAPLAADPVAFTRKPSVTRSDAGATVAFAVSGSTDVEIAVLDDNGRVVRHLAAGLLGGPTPPPAPLAAGLEQKVTWDGKTNTGQPVPAGDYRFRVRLGMGAMLGGFVGENRHHFSGFWGMATDGDGNVYILGPSTGNSNPAGTRYMQVFSREGKYVRTIMPPPAELPLEKVEPFNVIQTGPETWVPRNYRGTWPVLYGGLDDSQAIFHRVTDDGVIWFTDGKNIGRIRRDGSGVGKSWARFAWKEQPHRTIDKWMMHWRSEVAVSPDGKHIYAAGLYQTKPFQKRIDFPRGRIYRAAVDGGYFEPFADLQTADGKSASPFGMAFDNAGNLLVCEAAGGRVVAFDADGKQIGQLKIDHPRLVAVHRKTGAIYVLTYASTGSYSAAKSIVKFDGLKSGKELARFKLRDAGNKAVMALDDSAEPAVLWVGIDRSKAGDAWKLGTRAEVLRLEDAGDALAPTDHNVKFQDGPMGVVTRLAVHPENDVVVARGEYAHAAAYNGITAERIKAPFDYAVDMAVGRDGYFYVQTDYHWDGPMLKFDRDLQPVTVDENRKPANMVQPRVFGRYGNGFGVAGYTVDENGRTIIAQQLDEQTIAGDCVVAFGPDGTPEDPGRMKGHERFKKHGMWDSALIGPLAGVIGNVAVDGEGYIYLAIRGVPLDHTPPPGFQEDTGYGWVTGSVLKFKPEGGSVFHIGGPDSRPPRKAVEVPADKVGIKLVKRSGYPRGQTFAENAVAAYPGVGSMSGGFGVGCRCRQPMFQLDKFGRLFLPNALTCTVTVLDNAGNVLMTVGRYGNGDSRDGEVGIPLGWPEAVGVSQRAIYVADVLNRRIVRMDRTWAAEEVVAIK